jgi:transglutaminase-like putative cysteine protease
MRIRAGYEITYTCAAPTPALLMLSIHPSREQDLLTPHEMQVSPPLPVVHYRDLFGNSVSRLTLPAGTTTLSCDFEIYDTGLPDEVAPNAKQWPVDRLPNEVLTFLLASRYCDTEALGAFAWQNFAHVQPGWARVQAICDYVNERITFGYHHARPTRTASEGHAEQVGVCRDFAHLAVTLCRCMNIPARYCTGYLGDIGIPAVPDPMDFSAWFEVFLDGRWFTFDARHNTPRIGRILMATGRDAADVAISTAFGFARLDGFKVITDEVAEEPQAGETVQKTHAVGRASAGTNVSSSGQTDQPGAQARGTA